MIIYLCSFFKTQSFVQILFLVFIVTIIGILLSGFASRRKWSGDDAYNGDDISIVLAYQIKLKKDDMKHIIKGGNYVF